MVCAADGVVNRIIKVGITATRPSEVVKYLNLLPRPQDGPKEGDVLGEKIQGKSRCLNNSDYLLLASCNHLLFHAKRGDANVPEVWHGAGSRIYDLPAMPHAGGGLRLRRSRSCTGPGALSSASSATGRRGGAILPKLWCRCAHRRQQLSELWQARPVAGRNIYARVTASGGG